MRQLKISKQITNRESQSLDKYLQEIGKVDLLTPDEEVELAKRIKEGDQIALEKLQGVPQQQRGAQLRTVVGLIFPPRLRSGQAGNEKVYTFEGILKGHIAETPTMKRIAGYPFRSIFVPLGENKHLGEMSLVAHRKQAIEKALPIIKKFLISNF